jgi:hypothetical protein
VKIKETFDYKFEFCYWDLIGSNHQALMDNLCTISLKDGKRLLCLLIEPYLIVSYNKKDMLTFTMQSKLAKRMEPLSQTQSKHKITQ